MKTAIILLDAAIILADIALIVAVVRRRKK